MKKIGLMIVLAIYISGIAIAQAPPKTIPEFTFLKSDNNTAFTNKNLAKGKPIFIIFFDTDCEHCQRAMTYLNEHYSDFKKAAIYPVTLDNEQRVTAFLAKYGTHLRAQKNITFLNDFQNSFVRKFGPKKYPSLFLFSSAKKLIKYDDEADNMVKFADKIKAMK